jgi:hypothetical protein
MSGNGQTIYTAGQPPDIFSASSNLIRRTAVMLNDIAA